MARLSYEPTWNIWARSRFDSMSRMPGMMPAGSMSGMPSMGGMSMSSGMGGTANMGMANSGTRPRIPIIPPSNPQTPSSTKPSAETEVTVRKLFPTSWLWSEIPAGS